MKRDPQGRYVTTSTVDDKAQAYVPARLPPCPPIDWTPELRSKFDKALLDARAVGASGPWCRDTSLFFYMYAARRR